VIEIRPDIGSAIAACLANEQRFNIGKPDLIVPLIGGDPGPMAAFIIRAIDQHRAMA